MITRFYIFLFLFLSVFLTSNLEASLIRENEEHPDIWGIAQAIKTNIHNYYNGIIHLDMLDLQTKEKKISSLYQLEEEIRKEEEKYNLYRKDLEELDNLETQITVEVAVGKESREHPDYDKILEKVQKDSIYGSYGNLRRDHFYVACEIEKTKAKLETYNERKDAFEQKHLTPKRILKYMKKNESSFMLQHTDEDILYYIRPALDQFMHLKETAKAFPRL